MTARELRHKLTLAEAELRSAHIELQQTNSELLRLTLELDDRVAERTGALTKSNAALRRGNIAREAAVRRLREQAELLNRASEVIVRTDSAERIRFWNQGATRLLGWTASETRGQPLSEVFFRRRGDALALGRPTTRVGADWIEECEVRRRDGAIRLLQVSVTMLRGGSGQKEGELWIGSDVTEKRELEEKFLRAQRLESIGMLAAGIAHDLNNVLAPIGLVSSLLRARQMDPGLSRWLNTLDSSVVRGSALVRQILGFAAGVGGEPRPVQLKHLISDVAGIVSQTFPKSISLVEEIPRDLWPINAQPSQIHQVILNLCVNARDAMPQGGVLRIRAENRALDAVSGPALGGEVGPGSWIVLHVEDSGVGIPAEVLARIWEPFFTTKEPGKGTGLGLSTVRGIVQNHGGMITCESVPGRGTVFRVYIPASNGGGDAAEPIPTAVADLGHNETILVVEDEATNREILSDIFDVAGYRVLAAAHGAEAVEVLRREAGAIALVITDYDMPVMNGAELSRLIRAEYPGLKVLLMSGDDRMKGVACDGLVSKPYNAQILLEKIAGLLAAPTTVEATQPL